ncbi:Pept-C1 domain-containing protein [Aphelenchoides besseyi]|nr:Pept-C1 domain-containing protein [Aphelenchoides besseyi]
MQLASLLLLVVGVSLSLAVPAPKTSNGLRGQELVDHINKEGQWKAALHPRFAGKTIDQVRGHLGAIRKRPANLTKSFKSSELNDVVDFDSRAHWPNCADVIGYIYDQSACGDCWAVSTAASVSDQICVKSDGKDKTPVSAIDLTTCCKRCGDGCQGGDVSEAYDYLYQVGVVSGSDYFRDSYCKPYPFAPCEHHNNKTAYQKCGDVVDTPKCTKSCQKGYKHTYDQDRIFTEGIFSTEANVKEVQDFIKQYGSVVVTFDVYEDFLYYQSGVYQHTGDDEPIGGHAVRAIGWGTENEVDYWLLANQWNSDWGDNGLVKFIRGVNNCGIEDYVTVGGVKL